MESETLCLKGPLKLRDYIHIQSIGTESKNGANEYNECYCVLV